MRQLLIFVCDGVCHLMELSYSNSLSYFNSLSVESDSSREGRSYCRKL